MATAAGSEADSVDLGAGLAEDSGGVVLGVEAALVAAAALAEVVAAEVGLLVGSFSLFSAMAMWCSNSCVSEKFDVLKVVEF